jgi:hypothetical protein
MKKALIILYGLPRTFKITSNSLFNKIIEPNMKNYDIDIMINTDYIGKGLTLNRPDTTKTGYSVYNYNSIDSLKEDLYRCYNKYNQLKKIYFYNLDLDFCNPWFLSIKRIEMILSELYETNQKYDLYMCFRMDSILTNIIDFDKLDNQLMFITGNFIRPSFFHNRDIFDGCFIGNYIPFMIFTQSFIKIANNIVSKIESHKYFFLNKPICDDNYTNFLDIPLINPSELDLNDLNKVENRIGLINSNYEIYDNYCFAGNQDIFMYYNSHGSYFHKLMLFVFRNILNESGIILSEKINNHYEIIRNN